MNAITQKQLSDFKNHLANEEKSRATLEKYYRDTMAFFEWLCEKEVNKTNVLEYKAYLMEKYKPTSVNSILSALNSFFSYSNRYDCKVKIIKIQKQIFSEKSKELSKAEYGKLVAAANSKKRKRLSLLIQTICSTGIRVSELKFIDVNAVQNGIANINCKGKLRQIFIPKQLRKKLIRYAKSKKITSGTIFVTKNGKPLDRSNIWSDMKKLCDYANIPKDKVFPHNLRHLFARTYYKLQKDIVHLADILGHSSINTTRIYTMESSEIHMRKIEKLGLLKC